VRANIATTARAIESDASQLTLFSAYRGCERRFHLPYWTGIRSRWVEARFICLSI